MILFVQCARADTSSAATVVRSLTVLVLTRLLVGLIYYRISDRTQTGLLTLASIDWPRQFTTCDANLCPEPPPNGPASASCPSFVALLIRPIKFYNITKFIGLSVPHFEVVCSLASPQVQQLVMKLHTELATFDSSVGAFCFSQEVSPPATPSPHRVPNPLSAVVCLPGLTLTVIGDTNETRLIVGLVTVLQYTLLWSCFFRV